MSKVTGTETGTVQTPSGEPGTVAPELPVARHQPWCSAEVPTGANRCPRCNIFQPANTAALKHGNRRLHPTNASVERSRQIRDERVRSLGGGYLPADLSGLVDDYAFIQVQLETVRTYLHAAGTFTERGRRRAALDTYLALSQRAERIGAQIQDLDAKRSQTRMGDPSAVLSFLTDDELHTVGEVVEAYLALGQARMEEAAANMASAE